MLGPLDLSRKCWSWKPLFHSLPLSNSHGLKTQSWAGYVAKGVVWAGRPEVRQPGSYLPISFLPCALEPSVNLSRPQVTDCKPRVVVTSVFQDYFEELNRNGGGGASFLPWCPEPLGWGPLPSGSCGLQPRSRRSCPGAPSLSALPGATGKGAGPEKGPS